jgi:NAD-dependent deacetylase
MKLPANASIVILTGAGISAESGISTFRDANGLWEQHRIQDVATPQGYERDPDLVHRFYNARRRQLRDVQPNAAHQALAQLERRWPGGVMVVTQNVDDLHDRAGSRNLVHMHGELRKVRCQACGKVLPWEADCARATRCPACQKPQRLRPHVVWFGEAPMDMDLILPALARCGLFVSVGTSGKVHPAAGFIDDASPFAYTLELNLEPCSMTSSFFEHRQGKATDLVPALVDELLAGIACAIEHEPLQPGA